MKREFLFRPKTFSQIFNNIVRLKFQNSEYFKLAFCNIFIFLGISIFGLVCLILGPFCKPLVWAFLVGALLFPIKRKLATFVKGWFEKLETSNINFFMAISLFPFNTIENFGCLLVDLIKRHWKIMIYGLLLVFVTKMLFSDSSTDIFNWFCEIFLFGCSNFCNFIKKIKLYHVLISVSFYILIVKYFWQSKYLVYLSMVGQILWILLFSYACSYLGPLQLPTFMFLVSYILIATVYSIKNIIIISKKKEINFSLSAKIQFLKHLDKAVHHKCVNAINLRKSKSATEDDLVNENFLSDERITVTNISDSYFKYLFFACFLTFMYRYIWVLLFLTFPIFVHLFKNIAVSSGLFNIFKNRFLIIWTKIAIWSYECNAAILPLCLPGMLEINYKLQVLIRNYLRSSVDIVTTIIIILLMSLVLVFVTVMFCFNIYSETIEIAYLGKDLLNKTFTNQPDLKAFFPSNVQESIDDILDNAHSYGKRTIEQYVKDILKDANPINAENVTTQILNVWDRLIQYWIDFNKVDTYGPRVPKEALKNTLEEITNNPVSKNGFFGWAKSNTSTILEITESIWHILRTNITLIAGIVGSIFSIILSGGKFFMEFLLDTILFFTALFYFLSMSDQTYSPLQIVSYFGLTSSPEITETLEASISGVLIASLKCSVFHGGFTWLIHNLLGARIVFFPSAIATILSATPFVGCYWCGLPAFLELWLAQDKVYSGILLIFLLLFVPPLMEQEVHSEIKCGVHPYFTGLAIAGGMYWMGWQGAIFGPLILCVFIGIFEAISKSFHCEE